MPSKDLTGGEKSLKDLIGGGTPREKRPYVRKQESGYRAGDGSRPSRRESAESRTPRLS